MIDKFLDWLMIAAGVCGIVLAVLFIWGTVVYIQLMQSAIP